jgi:hypothetical protein
LKSKREKGKKEREKEREKKDPKKKSVGFCEGSRYSTKREIQSPKREHSSSWVLPSTCPS